MYSLPQNPTQPISHIQSIHNACSRLNFFNDSITAGESQVFDYDSGGGRPAGAGKAALKKGVHAAMAGRKKKGNGGAMSQADAFKQRLDQRPYDAISGMNVDPRFALRE